MAKIDPRFGQEMKKLRKAIGISQRKLAEIVGLGSGYISRIERAEFKPPSEEKIIAIADALGTNRDWMLSLSGKVSSDVMNAVKKHPKEMSKAVRSIESSGDWFGIGIVVLYIISLFKGENEDGDISEDEWKTLMLELRKEGAKLPPEKQLNLIKHIRDLMDNWEKDVRG